MGSLQRRATKELAAELGRPKSVHEKIQFESTLGNFVSTRDGNLMLTIVVPGHEAGEIAKLVRLFGYRINVHMEVQTRDWDAG